MNSRASSAASRCVTQPASVTSAGWRRRRRRNIRSSHDRRHDKGGSENLLQRVQTTRARQGGHTTSDLHGKRPADWADVLRDQEIEPPSAPPIKHCWYDGPHGRQAALLLGWRHVEGYYRGRIAVAAPELYGWAIVEMWVEQGMLSPVKLS